MVLSGKAGLIHKIKKEKPMATYVISDIHGQLEKLETLMEKINLKDSDNLYVLGDVVDRGPKPMECLQYLMAMPNVHCLAGNHDIMFLDCIKFLDKEITKEFIKQLSDDQIVALTGWIENGGTTTMQQYSELDEEEKEDIIDFLMEFELYEELTVNGQKYLLVHAGIDNYVYGKPLNEYEMDDFLWVRTDYELPYLDDTITISGHTPTQTIVGNSRPGYIFKTKYHIAIDCGASHSKGRLAAYCIETGQEFYSMD